VLLALLQAQATRYRLADTFADANATLLLPRAAFAWLLLGFALLWLQIALGGWVSTNYAVLACNEFPQCQGQWLPPMNLSEGFELWRALGQTGAGSAVSLPALTAIHVVHRMFAFAVLAVLGVAAWQMHHSSAHGSLARRAAGWIALLLLWQLVTGLSNVVLGWPLLAAVSHTGGAAGLVVVITGVLSAAQLGQSSLDDVHSGHSSGHTAASRYFSGSTL
jgi:heme a synthase